MTAEFALERSVVIHARPRTVFRFFTDSDRFSRWWGPGSEIDATIGGLVKIRYPNGVTASGRIEQIVPERRVAFTYGYESGEPFGPGESLVIIELQEIADGTRLRLRHLFPTEAARTPHGPGWRYQLAVFARLAADDEFAAAEEAIDAWFRYLNQPSGAFDALAEAGEFRDDFGLTAGAEELAEHLRAARTHLRWARLDRRGGIRRCHAVALADYAWLSDSGDVAATGTFVFQLGPAGRIERVVGVPS